MLLVKNKASVFNNFNNVWCYGIRRESHGFFLHTFGESPSFESQLVLISLLVDKKTTHLSFPSWWVTLPMYPDICPAATGVSNWKVQFDNAWNFDPFWMP